MSKCKHSKYCEDYADNHTCNDDSEADGYCGLYNEFEKENGEVKLKQ